jgi:hypothetical protein
MEQSPLCPWPAGCCLHDPGSAREARTGVETHEIHLRGGWEWAASDGPPTGPARLTLPTRWEPAAAGRLSLTRRFQRPPRSPDSRVVLRISRAPGIRSIHINGQPLGPLSPDLPGHEIVLDILAPRNELVLEIDPPRDGSDWGFISLVFLP